MQEVCKNHPQSLAGWRCTGCGAVFCDACIKITPVGAASLRTCRDCGERVETLAAKAEAAQAEVKSRQDRNFFMRLPGAFAYPFKGSGIILLIIGGLFVWCLQFLRYAFFFGMLGTLVVVGYLNAYMLRIISGTGSGEDEMPDWPSFADFYTDIIRPYFLVLGVTAVSFLPAILFTIAVMVLRPSPLLIVPGYIALIGLGLLYWPMALLAVAMIDAAEGLSPMIVIPAIFKAPLAYLMALVVLGLLVLVRVLSTAILSSIPIAGSILDGVLSFYFLIVEMRILGLLYYANEDRFNWFESYVTT